VLDLLEFRFLVVEHSLEIYAGLIAIVFAALGIRLGLTLTRTKEVTKEVVVVREVPAPAPISLPDPARAGELGLTPRELEILQHIAMGLSTREMAEKLFVSENTIKTHSGRLFDKLGVSRRTQAVHVGKQLGLIT